MPAEETVIDVSSVLHKGRLNIVELKEMSISELSEVAKAIDGASFVLSSGEAGKEKGGKDGDDSDDDEEFDESESAGNR